MFQYLPNFCLKKFLTPVNQHFEIIEVIVKTKIFSSNSFSFILVNSLQINFKIIYQRSSLKSLNRKILTSLSLLLLYSGLYDFLLAKYILLLPSFLIEFLKHEIWCLSSIILSLFKGLLCILSVHLRSFRSNYLSNMSLSLIFY